MAQWKALPTEAGGQGLAGCEGMLGFFPLNLLCCTGPRVPCTPTPNGCPAPTMPSPFSCVPWLPSPPPPAPLLAPRPRRVQVHSFGQATSSSCGKPHSAACMETLHVLPIAGTRSTLGLRTDTHATGSTHREVLAPGKEQGWSTGFLEETRTSLKVAGEVPWRPERGWGEPEECGLRAQHR